MTPRTRKPKTCPDCAAPIGTDTYRTQLRTDHYCKETPVSLTPEQTFLGLGEPNRDGYGRPLIIPPDGGKPVPYTRISTFADALSEAGGLITWKARNVALAVARHEDLAGMIAGLKYGDKALDEHIETAIGRVDTSAAWGTAVHSFTEGDDASPFVPERMAGDVAAYTKALADHGLTVAGSEQFVVNDELGVAGTFDGLYTSTQIGRVLGDKKTGRLKPQAVAIQLSCYAGGAAYDPATGERTPLDVRQDIALLIHIPKGEARCDVYTVDLEAGRRAAAAAAWVRQWRKRDDITAPLTPFTAAVAS